MLVLAAAFVTLDRLQTGVELSPQTRTSAEVGQAAQIEAAQAEHVDQADQVPAAVPTAIADPEPAVDPVIPRRIRVPTLGVAADVVPVGAPGGVLTPPADPDLLGWWEDGALAGAGRGSVLVAGHTVHDGGGALEHLERLMPGDTIIVTGGTETRLEFRVTRVRVLLKGELARQAATIFDQHGAAQLVLMTCEEWNGTGYDSNVVVTATRI